MNKPLVVIGEPTEIINIFGADGKEAGIAQMYNNDTVNIGKDAWLRLAISKYQPQR